MSLIVTPKMLEDLDIAVFSNDDIDLANVDLGIVELFSDDVGFVNVNLNNVCHDDVFDDDGLDTISLNKPITWCNKYKQAYKKK